MKHSIQSENSFVVELLTTLQQEKFSPAAWWRFLKRSWHMSCKTAGDHPTLKRSWLYTTLFIGLLTLTIVIISFIEDGANKTFHLLPAFLFCVIWQQSDLFWHLGLNRQTGKLLPRVGLANLFTWLRGLAVAYLLGRLFGGIATPPWLALLVFLVGVATDILDGQVARYTKTQSKLGQIADGEADFCLYLTLTIILIQNAVLPLWLGLLMLLRFCVPLVGALVSYFLFAHLLRFGSTLWGKGAGLAQSLYFLVLLAPPMFVPITRVVKLPLLIVTLILLIAAPIAQIVTNIRTTA